MLGARPLIRFATVMRLQDPMPPKPARARRTDPAGASDDHIDFSHREKQVLGIYPAQASGAAVLGSVFRREIYMDRKNVPMMLDETRKGWSARPHGLREAGWPKLEDEKSLKYCLNCPPFGIITLQDRRTRCCHIHTCLFCAGRATANIYNDLVEGLLHGMGNGASAKISVGSLLAWKRQRIGHGIVVKPGKRQGNLVILCYGTGVKE
jgi:hypothetical protein